MPQFDIIIVGAGAGGCALAGTLAKKKPDLRIALIETGPRAGGFLNTMPLGIALLVARKSAYNYAYQTVPQAGLNGRTGYQPRGRGVGGSSLINAMICIRGQPQDYDQWAELGCAGWGWSDVLPYFQAIEMVAQGGPLRGDAGPLCVAPLSSHDNPAREAFIEAARSLQYPHNPDFNGPSQEGVGAYQVFQKEGRRFDAGKAFLTDAPANLTVMANRRVANIHIENGRAVGVDVKTAFGSTRLTAARDVVLCAGAFGSPQLLMLSGVGPGHELQRHGIDVRADRPEVGRNLQDHLDYTTSVVAPMPGALGFGPSILPTLLPALVSYFRSGTGLLTSNSAEAGGFIKSSPNVDRPDLQLHYCVGIVDDHARRLHMSRGVSLHACVLRPESRGVVTLSGPSVEHAPVIDPNFLSAPSDLELLKKGARINEAILSAPAFQRYKVKPLYEPFGADDATLEETIRNRADTIYHPVGTCRMGADADAVVDPQLRVRGVEGLRVADASIMPRLISGNTQAPSCMIGAKAADLIAAG